MKKNIHQKLHHEHYEPHKRDFLLSKVNKINFISKIILVICFILIILISSFTALVYNKNFYNNEYEKNKIYEKYGKNLTLRVTENIFNFLKNKEDIGVGIDKELGGNFEGMFFTYNEKSHMYDVKKKIRNSFLIYYIVMALIVIFFFLLYFNSFNFLHDLGGIFAFTGGIVIFLTIVLYFADFSALFDLFHKIVFTGNYMFDQTSRLVGMFPLKFFGDFAYRILFFSFIKAVIFLVAGIILLVSSSSSSAFSKK